MVVTNGTPPVEAMAVGPEGMVGLAAVLGDGTSPHQALAQVPRAGPAATCPRSCATWPRSIPGCGGCSASTPRPPSCYSANAWRAASSTPPSSAPRTGSCATPTGGGPPAGGDIGPHVVGRGPGRWHDPRPVDPAPADLRARVRRELRTGSRRQLPPAATDEFRRGEMKSSAGQRVVGLPAELGALLRDHRQQQDQERSAARQLWDGGDWVFASPTGAPSIPTPTTASGSRSCGLPVCGTVDCTTPGTRRRRCCCCWGFRSVPRWGSWAGPPRRWQPGTSTSPTRSGATSPDGSGVCCGPSRRRSDRRGAAN